MYGFSVYLDEGLSAEDHNYLLAMRNAGFQYVFTSLLVPGRDAELILERLSQLAKWCKDLELKLVADISKDELVKLEIDINNVDQIKSLNLYGLRIDAGILMRNVAKLSQVMPVALNASTITKQDLLHLKEENANFANLDAWHNFYPHPETGLASQWLKEKNDWLHSFNLKTVAFVSGDGKKSGPLFEGLPTIESQRYTHPLAASLTLKELGCDYVFIGDERLKPATITTFARYIKDNVISLHLDRKVDALFERTWHNRPDAAAQVVRLAESRALHLFETTPQDLTGERNKGTVTCDNERYGRYAGEIQITKQDLPANDKTNVLAKVSWEDLALLDHIGSNQAIIFADNEES